MLRSLLNRHRVLLVCDRPSWSYDAIARALVKHNHDRRLQLDVFHLKGREDALKREARHYDLVFVLGWQLLADLEDGHFGERLPFLDPDKTLTGIHSHHAWDDRRTTPDRSVSPPPCLVDFLGRYRGVNAVSRRLYELFSAAGVENIGYTPNGVDVELFRPVSEPGRTPSLRVGFSGSKKHDWRKGVSEFIEPAAAGLTGVELRLAMPGEGYVPLDEMPRFYNEIDVYACASSSEGFSLSVLEASACGRPVVSTRVGGSEDLIEDGLNGFLVDRTVEAIRSKLAYFLGDPEALRRMGAANRKEVEQSWSWESRAPAWLDFIRTALA
jgi:glycosyltransferase involved in cell wall biosynthesis